MFGKVLVALLVLAPMAKAAGPPPPYKEQPQPLVGVWKLVRYADTPKGGEPIYAFGESPIGQFVFTNDGHMSVHIMHNPPNPQTAVVDPDPDACMPSWYCGYFGTYTVDYAKNQWTTRVLGGNVPTYVGTDQTRTFKLSKDRLVISGSYMVEGRSVTLERILVRYHAPKK